MYSTGIKDITERNAEAEPILIRLSKIQEDRENKYSKMKQKKKRTSYEDLTIAIRTVEQLYLINKNKANIVPTNKME